MSTNLVVLSGNLGKPPELRYTPGGTAVLSMSLATNEYRKSGDESTKETLWHNIVAFGRLAETINGFSLEKGTTVIVQGRLSYNSWEGKDGETKHRTEIIANSIDVTGNRSGKGTSGGSYKPTKGAAPVQYVDDDEEFPF